MSMKLLFSTLLATVSLASSQAFAVDMVVHNAKIKTHDGKTYSAFSVDDGKISELSSDGQSLLKKRNKDTVVIDAKGRRVIPGMNDSHTHVVRGGRFYNLETRWDGVKSLKEGLALIKEQAKRTPKGQWVRVVGGWSPYQFEEKRLPTPEELTEAAPNTPVFVLHLYSGGVLNQKGLKALGVTKSTKAPEGSRYERDSNGNATGRLLAVPHPAILYQTISKLPQMSEEEQLNSSKQYYRKLLSLGMTSASDAGGGGHSFPENYEASTMMAKQGDLPMRVSYFLFPQKPSYEMQSFLKWMSARKADTNTHSHYDNGYVLEGGGELLATSASDFENFTAPRPDLKDSAEKDLEEVVRLHLLQGWPFRLHATYDESITRMLNVLEDIDKTQPVNDVRWVLDHVETISDKNLKRLKALGGAISIQGRMTFAGEDFLERYGKEQTLRTPPLRKIIDMDIPLGLGTDGTRVASFNPWPAYYWAVTGKTLGGLQLYKDNNILSREEALKHFTLGSANISGEEKVKGDLKPGMYADFAILNHDILEVDAKRLLDTQSLLTVVNGDVQFSDKIAYPKMYKPLLDATPKWSPVNYTNRR